MDKISLVPDVLFNIGPIGVTNANLTLAITVLVISIIGFFVGKKARLVPTRFQVAIEAIFMFFYDKVQLASPSEKYFKPILYIVTTIFILVLTVNLFSFMPLLHSFRLGEASLLKTATAHFSFPIAITILVVFLSNITAFVINPFKYLGNFIRIKEFLKVRSVGTFLNALLEIFLGVMGIVGELAKLVSLSARLFGNMLAGELISIIILGLVPFVAPIPFYALGLLSAVIQALVIALLSMQYLGGMIGSVLDPEDEKRRKSIEVSGEIVA